MTDLDTKTVDGFTETFEKDDAQRSGGAELEENEFEMLFRAHLYSLNDGMCPGVSSPLSREEIVAKLERMLDLAKFLKR